MCSVMHMISVKETLSTSTSLVICVMYLITKRFSVYKYKTPELNLSPLLFTN